jgi:uncharacterized protein YkwD
MDWDALLGVALLAVLAIIMFFFLSGVGVFEREYAIGTTTTTLATTTTARPRITTTTTLITDYASMENEGTLAWIEKRAFDLVNQERADNGLSPLKWNEQVADVCRLHSKDMMDHDFFAHTGSDGSNSSYRLIRDGILYWNQTGENIARISGIYSYIKNIQGDIIETNYKSQEDIAQDAVDGWMESPTHRANILRADFDEAGMGVKTVDDIYYFTQDFIVRVTCGYKQSPCCSTKGYYPWCYNPWKCVDGVCN